jgi:hypothetical protein
MAYGTSELMGEGDLGKVLGVRGAELTADVSGLGQVVRCRDRIWAVNELTPSSLPIDPITGTRPHHLVRMSSLEDDGFGDELTVIWEIESGTQVIRHQELPRPEIDRLDAPERLEAFLDAVRWGAVATADSRALQAPFRSGITIGLIARGVLELVA